MTKPFRFFEVTEPTDTTERAWQELAEEFSPVPKRRRCLKCGELFDSESAGNRICRDCQIQNARILLPSETKGEFHGL